jgi:hypothetical protein
MIRALAKVHAALPHIFGRVTETECRSRAVSVPNEHAAKISEHLSGVRS